MNQLAMRREGTKLVCLDEMSAEELSRIDPKAELLVTVKTPRRVRQFRFAWALAKKVSDACDFLPDAEAAMTYLKLKAHHAHILVDPKTGETYLTPKSIAYESLSQQAFDRILNRMVFIVCNEIVPGLSSKALRDEILAMVGTDKTDGKAQAAGT